MDKKQLRLLLAEDNPNDAELILRELRNAGFRPDYQRVETEADYLCKLDPNLDIILSDFSMPQFNGMRALQLLKETNLDIPFILISGTIGEESAVWAMRDGAADYLLKDRLTRLGEAVKHALEEKRNREEGRRTEEKLARLRQQHALILNSAGDGIYGIDLDGNIMFQNPKAAELFRWHGDEFVGKPEHATIHYRKKDGNPNPIESCAIHEAMRDGSTRRVANDLFWRKDGKSFPVKFVAAPMKDEHGQIVGAIVVFNDITAEVAAEARIKLQAEQYRLLFDTNPNAMWVFDSKSLQILAVNQTAIEQYGYSREEFLNLTLLDLRRQEERAALAESLSTPNAVSHFSGEFNHQRKDGSVIRVLIYSSPVVWDWASARMVTAINVTERKRNEERLLEQAEIIQRAQDAIVVRNYDDDRVTLWNPGAERLYGWTSAEAIGRRTGELMFRDEAARAALLNQLDSVGEYHGEIRHIAKDGREVIVSSRVTLLRSDDGKPRAVLGINSDITEKKKLETQLLRAQRLESIGTLASGVAHDLNNVLTPILMSAELVRHRTDNEDTESSMKLIEESARRGSSIVNQVLTFARGVTGERVSIKPSHLIDEMVDIARKTFPKSIDIVPKYSQDLWSIQGDPTQLHQVLLNLSVNARDAMPDGGTLVLAAANFNIDENYAAMTPGATVGPHVVFQVNDTGSGMPRAMIEKIFDPFFTTKEIGKGTGLGLSTALGIVKSHGGAISVYSEPGKGTTFKILLPAANAPVENKENKPGMEILKGDRELVLVVDDESSILRVTQAILEAQNYRVISAPEGPDALAVLAQKQNEINLVLTDIMLPHMDGVALIRTMKKMKPDLSFIASTGQGEQTRLSELQSLGVSHFLSKPYDSQKLLQTMHDALAEKKVT